MDHSVQRLPSETVKRHIMKSTRHRDSWMGLWIIEPEHGPADEPDDYESAEHVEDDLPTECVGKQSAQEHAAHRSQLST